MRDISQPPEKYTFRYQMMAIARDVVTISAVVSVLSGILWTLTRPYLAPFLELPAQVAEINARLAPISAPHLVEFEGHGIVLNGVEVVRGEEIRILYNLRRNADCATEIEMSFINVDTGTLISTGTSRAVQAPVTEDFTYFILALTVPQTLPPGRYSYFPRLTPLNCGIYQAYSGAMSTPFTVTRG